MTSRAARLGAFAIPFAVVLVLDQLTKWAAREFLGQGSVTLIPGVIDLHLVYNEGAAFSLGVGWAWLFVVFAALLCAVCIWVVARRDVSKVAACLLGLGCAGGAGNLIDRVSAGHVTDFLMTTFMSFPVFNVADIAITCAFVALFVYYWFIEPRDQKEGEVHA